MTIRNRILVPLAVGALLLTGFMVWVVLDAGSALEAARERGRRARTMAAMASELTVRFHQVDQSILEAHGTSDVRHVQEAVDGVEANQRVLQELAAADISPRMARSVARFQDVARERRTLVRQLLTAARAAEPGDAPVVSSTDAALWAVRARVAGGHLSDVNHQALFTVGEAFEVIEAQETRFVSRLLLGGGTAFVLLCVALLYYVRTIVRPVRGLTQVAADLATPGAALPELPNQAPDEVDALGQALLGMATSLQQANALLEERVAARTLELSDANEVLASEIVVREQAEATLQHNADRLARANMELQRFAFVASHHLQEPLRAITTYAQLLTSAEDGLTEDGRRWLGFVGSGAERMRDLIRALLTYARADQEETPHARVVLADTVEQVLEQLAPQVLAREAHVEVGALHEVVGNSAQLQVVLGNLVSYALKYNPKASPWVGVHSEPDGDRIRLVVEDNGPGIEERHRARVFEAFQRLHRNDEIPGTGIGLSVSRRIAEQHGGSIDFEARADGGTRFVVNLRAAV